MTTPEIDPDEVLEDYDPKLLPCRGDQHSWGRDYVWRLIDPETLERLQVCCDCKLKRIAEVDYSTGARLGPYQYRGYPQGYKTGGTGLRKADFQRRLNNVSIEKTLKTGKLHGAPDPKLVEKRQAKEAG